LKLIIYLKAVLLILLFSADSLQAQIAGVVNADASKAKYKANTLVYIEKANGPFTLSSKNPTMDQKGLVFHPRVLPVVAGTTVEFLNNDNVMHNVFSPDKCANSFNLGSWGQGESRKYKFEKVGCQSVILCNVHPEMEAFVVVLQNPYFSITDKDGNFKINNVPPGNYVLKVWNEKLKSAAKDIIVPASGKLNLNFDLAR